MRLLFCGSPPEVTRFSMNCMTKVFGPANGLGRRLRFDNQHVAIRKCIERSWMLKSLGNRFNLQPRCYSGHFACLPSNDRREMHRRKQVLFNLRQNGIGPDLTLNIKGLAAMPRASARAQRRSRRSSLRMDLIRRLLDAGVDQSIGPSRR